MCKWLQTLKLIKSNQITVNVFSSCLQLVESLSYFIQKSDEVHSCPAVTHSLQYFYTASSGISSFPELLTVGMVDGQPFSYYDSEIQKEIPKQDWMAKAEAPEYWAIETQASINAEQVLKVSIDIMKKRFNQTGGE